MGASSGRTPTMGSDPGPRWGASSPDPRGQKSDVPQTLEKLPKPKIGGIQNPVPDRVTINKNISCALR